MPSRLFALCLAAIVLIGPLSVHLFLPAIPAVKAEFALTDAMAQLTFTIGILAMSLSTLVYGTLADRYGRRPVLMSGLVLFLVGSAIAATTVSLPMLMLGRIVQCVGAGCGTTLVRTIARDAYGQAQLAKAIAYLTMFYTLGPMISPLMGGFLIDLYGWRAAFVFAMVLGAVITAGAWWMVHETHTGARRKLDGVGILRSYIEPFRNARFAAYVAQSGFSSGVFFALTAAVAVIMKEQLGRSSAEYGMYFLAFPFGFLTGNIISSRIGGRVGIERMVLAGSTMLMVAVILQSSLLLAGVITPLTLFGPGFLITMAQGIALPSAQSAAIALVPSSVGTAAGLGVFTQMFLGALTAQIYGMVATTSVVPLVVVMMTTSALVLVCGLVPTWLSSRSR